jgi:phosphoheptose isomerase
MMSARYQLFRKLMDLLGDEHEIVSATTHNYAGEIVIKAVDKASGITVTVTVAIEGEDGGDD